MTSVAQERRDTSMRIHEVRGGADVRLHVRDWGPADASPIVFIHGWSQNHLSWVRQYDSGLADEFRLVALDLRGHGMSGAPTEPGQYTDGTLWADDLAGVLDQLHLDRPVVVGWSYGAFVICDYLRKYGQERVGGLVFVAGAVRLGQAAFGSLIGPGFLDNFAAATSEDLPTRIAGTRGLVRAFAKAPLSVDDVETLLCGAMIVPPGIRAALAARDIDDDDVLADLTRPLLVAHGRADTIVLPAMAEHVRRVCPTAEISWYDEAAHVPHLEDPGRFNRELAAFVQVNVR